MLVTFLLHNINNLLNKALTDGIQGITYAMNFEGLWDRNLILDSQYIL